MNWPKYVIIYGPGTAWTILLLAGVAIFAVCRGQRYFLPRSWRRWTVVVAAIAVSYPAISFLRWARLKVTPLQPMYARANQPAPQFAFHLLEGASARNLDAYKGKVVLLNIWATWCDPCQAEMPDLDKLQRQYGNRGVVVITVSDESPQDILKFPNIASLRTVKAYVDDDQKLSPLFVRAEVARPVTHLIDSQGVLRETFVGYHDYSFYEQQVKTYLVPAA
jgi:thiol-disulfide isomerase/thioredoxin